MCKWLMGIALALLVLVPLDAWAQPKPAAPAAPAMPGLEGISAEKLVTIGVGVVAGVIVGEVLGGADGLMLIGGVAGGYLAAWWYENDRVRAGLRQPSAVAWNGERLALAR